MDFYVFHKFRCRIAATSTKQRYFNEKNIPPQGGCFVKFVVLYYALSAGDFPRFPAPIRQKTGKIITTGGYGHVCCHSPPDAHRRDDLRLSLEKYTAVQPAADGDPGAGGAVQPQRCGHRRQIRLQYLHRPGLGGLYHHAGLPVHRPAHRPGRRRQRGRGPWPGYGQRRGCGAYQPFLAAHLPVRRYPDLSGLRVLRRAHAPPAEHQGGAATASSAPPATPSAP